jgi:hypothetical protein
MEREGFNLLMNSSDMLENKKPMLFLVMINIEMYLVYAIYITSKYIMLQDLINVKEVEDVAKKVNNMILQWFVFFLTHLMHMNHLYLVVIALHRNLRIINGN